MNKIVLILTLLLATQGFSQKRIYYKDIVDQCISTGSNDAAMLDDVVYNCIKDKYISNYNFTSIKGETISTEAIDIPIVLLAAATWCAPCWGEIPALNKMVEKYDGKVKFIMLFSDLEKGVARMAEKLDKRIFLVPSTEKLENRSSLNVAGFIHKLDYPSAYLITDKKRILDFKRGALSPTKKMGWDEVNKINEQELDNFIKAVIK
ncbi:thioredoxin family protein [Tenacibaculum finnmarkense]|uniref:TlpA family protein disulfide reductase n=1 Tax=Tenacibaculum finnmarkense TaxID=2781243 RepID=UPI00187B16DA|nr:thioredoxin family protein [Tenacibaculum finnmarkense]MBE7645547.1 redoxin domain-containing protein [Tenacibaculum finnmarkense genomovar ulcerans]MBE7647626.1 redoxin domain-containing protein [Tenacibaculum finnmarkense genomovar ulcerans]MBE7687595.1 redoxin domain-containing protein [Tenacibaculum finnmarkense genomovar ulcerans]MCD8400085.1 thioredoxin family protein [Tenacibaculum finnmarkense genomovar ulcerans]MCD8409521.1 thioredoxin family protein [Tenacibaculum finnmarkense gen